MALVEVRPVEKVKWHGKKDHENFTQPIIIECLYDNATGNYATGLNDDDKKRLEERTGYDLSNNYTDKPHIFWNSPAGRIKLPAMTTVFDTKKPLDEIKVHVLKASKFVANSLKDYSEGLYPEATHIIYDEAEEVKVKASKIQRKRKAIKFAMKMSNDEKVNIIQILSDKSMRKQSQDFLDVEIDRLIEEDTLQFLDYAQKDPAETYLRAAILEGLHRNILTKEGNIVLYMGDKIGHNIDEAVKYFSDPNNQTIKASILEKLTN
jgi:hypothetical protein